MGAWGTGPFENDFAADWVYEIEIADDFDAVRSALSPVVDSDGYLDSSYGSVALAAAEVVVAAARKRPRAGLPEPILTWLREYGSTVADADLAVAVAAVDLVLGERSELRDLWAEAGDPAWLAAVQDLRRRLVSE